MYSLHLPALALFGMTYSLRRWQIYWGLTISISLDDSTTAGGAWHFCVGRLLLLRSKSGPGSYLYHYGLCELAQRQAVFVRKDKPSDRAIKSYRAKVAMTAGCISRIFDIPNYIYIPREIGNSANQNLAKWKSPNPIIGIRTLIHFIELFAKFLMLPAFP